MKVFYTDEDYAHKLNVVDDNNLLVGYDMSLNCCESFGYNFYKDQDQKEELPESDLEGFFFVDEVPEEGSEGNYEYNNSVSFKIYNPVTEEFAYLVLYNSHNGYYTHGFTYSGGQDFEGCGYL